VCCSSDYGTTTGYKIAKSLASNTDWMTSIVIGAIGNEINNNNATGFSALPSGSRGNSGYFNSQNYSGCWWSTRDAGLPYANYRYLTSDDYYLLSNNDKKIFGFSVRLIRN
jgi:uncharacterized protein (TIGR02145 family)